MYNYMWAYLGDRANGLRTFIATGAESSAKAGTHDGGEIRGEKGGMRLKTEERRKAIYQIEEAKKKTNVFYRLFEFALETYRLYSPMGM